MIRMEIIANTAVQDDIIEALSSVGENDYYSVIPAIHGRGRSVPKQGNHIWPEENFLMILYGDKKRQEKIEKVIQQIKEKFPDEGVKLFTIG